MRTAAGIPKGGMKFWRMPLGSGGYINAPPQFADDGTAVCAGDALGVWMRRGTDATWTELHSSYVLPSGTGLLASGGCGVAVCATNSNVIYFAAKTSSGGKLFKIANAQSASPTATLLPGGPWNAESNTGGFNRFWQDRLVVDPVNANNFLWGSQENKVVYSTNGGTSVSELAALGGATSTPHLVAVDRSSASGGSCQKWAYTVYGTGVYESTTGVAGPYSLLAGSPTSPNFLRYDDQGTLWACQEGGSSGNIYKKPPTGSFAKDTNAAAAYGGNFTAVARDPANPNNIVAITDNCEFIRSNDGGATWIGYWNYVYPINAANGGAMWQGAISLRWMNTPPSGGLNTNFSPAGCRFHPTNGSLWAASGVGLKVCRTPPTTWVPNDPVSRWYWYDDSEGIEMLNGKRVIVPPGGKAIIGTLDRCAWKINDEHKYNNFPNAPDFASSGFSHCYSLDWVPGAPNMIVTNCSYFIGGRHNGYSLDYGDTWTLFGSDHPALPQAGRVVFSDTNKGLWAPGMGARPAWTTNRGTTWTLMTSANGYTTSKGGMYWDIGSSKLYIQTKTDWAGTESYSAVMNAPSGAGAVSWTGGLLTITPPAASTVATLITFLNGNSTFNAAFTAAGSGTDAAVAKPSTAFFYMAGTTAALFELSYCACAGKAAGAGLGDIYVVNAGVDYDPNWKGVHRYSAVAGTWSRVYSGATLPYDVNENQIKCVSGYNDKLFYHGPTLFHQSDSNMGLYYSNNGGAAWAMLARSAQCWAFATETQLLSGQTFPSVYMVGKIDGGAYGVYRSDNWVPGSNDVAATWTYLVDYPVGVSDPVGDIECHPDTWGKLYISFINGGGVIGQYDSTKTLS